MQESKARELLKKYREGTLSATERALLESWYLELARTEGLEADGEKIGIHLDSLDGSVPETAPPGKSRLLPLLKWASAAASVLILLFSPVYWLHTRKDETVHRAAHTTDALPGDLRARLTLGSGASISLDEVSAGPLAQEGGISIVKTQEGEIAYRVTGSTKETTVAYNKIETPKAGQYRVILPDGTHAWLNAASSIRFPTVFPAGERVVETTGEVYFEVARLTAHNKRVPFRVYSGNQVTEVLGTVFNVNSYADEDAIKTTLLEGSIQVKMKDRPGGDIILKPGQQARMASKPAALSSSAPGIDVKNVDTGAVVAWKDGYFRFDGISLPELMRQLSRWYDMEVVYEGTIGEHEFVGKIERNIRLSKVLQILEIGGVRFRIEEKKIIVAE